MEERALLKGSQLMETLKIGWFGGLGVPQEEGLFPRLQRFPELFQPVLTLKNKRVHMATIK